MFQILLTLLVLTERSGQSTSLCTTRRCLAEMLIRKEYLSQPQYDNCTSVINVPLITYETLSVDTKNLIFTSRLQIALTWTDPDLAWNTSVYGYDAVVLPVNKIWTPELHVNNALNTEMKQGSTDLLVTSNGSVIHTVIMTTVVGCEVNLFKYPFATDFCPLALNAWAVNGCGMLLRIGQVQMTDGDSGDWRTLSVTMERGSGRDDRRYLLVELTIRYFNPFVSLVLPSILILIADIVSFSLPLEGRSSFKVTLVLSFIMFMVILNNLLPGDSKCSPLLRYHFCCCLVFLVASMLLTMVLTGLSMNANLMPLKKFKYKSLNDTKEKELGDEESKADITVIKPNASVEDSPALLKLVHYLETMTAQGLEKQKCQTYASKLDKIGFCVYLSIVIAYTVLMTYMFAGYSCTIDHFGFWE